MHDETESATEIFETLLKKTGDALLSGCFEQFSDCFTTPLIYEGTDRSGILETAADLEKMFRAAHRYLSDTPITVFARHCIAASFRNADEIVAAHETRMISHGRLIEGPYPSLSTITKCEDGKWRVSVATFTMSKEAEYDAVLTGRSTR